MRNRFVPSSCPYTMTRARWPARLPRWPWSRCPGSEGATDDLGKELLLGAEVAVDQRGGHPSVVGNLAGAGTLVTLGGEAARGRLEDGLAGRGGIPPPSWACFGSRLPHGSALHFLFSQSK